MTAPSSARDCATATWRGARGAQPRRDPRRPRAGDGAAARGLPRRPGRRGARPRRRDHRAAGRGQVDAAGRARARLAGRRAQRRGARRRPLVAALGRVAAGRPRADPRSTRPTPASSSARPPPPGAWAGWPPPRARPRTPWPPPSTSSWSRPSGSGQSETDVAEVADTVAVIVQPGSGDVLQFLKAGIMEIPDVLVVTKADLGDVALRARRDLHAALRSLGDRDTEVVALSSIAPVSGIDELVARARRPPRAPGPAGAAAGGAARQRAGRLRRRARRARPARPRRTARGRARPGRRRPRRRRAGPRRRPRRPGGRRVIRGIAFLLARLRASSPRSRRCSARPTSARRRPSGRSPSPARWCGCCSSAEVRAGAAACARGAARGPDGHPVHPRCPARPAPRSRAP